MGIKSFLHIYFTSNFILGPLGLGEMNVIPRLPFKIMQYIQSIHYKENQSYAIHTKRGVTGKLYILQWSLTY